MPAGNFPCGDKRGKEFIIELMLSNVSQETKDMIRVQGRKKRQFKKPLDIAGKTVIYYSVCSLMILNYCSQQSL